ncbi:hypothetical protein N7G274_002687 [Stereocaulon virgatum]|uniref:Uncharacterized protein n=1 Tax=Stereocaulon virgatum TaxID=373712 RepID=A0ABR4AJS0_9LECA
MDSSKSSGSYFGYKLVRADLLSQLQTKLHAADAQIEQLRGQIAQNIHNFDEEQTAHAATKRELEAAVGAKDQQYNEYHNIFESLDDQASKDREKIVEQASQIKELQAQNNPHPFHWLEPPSLETQFQDSREKVQDLTVKLQREIDYRDEVMVKARKFERNLEDVKVELRKAYKYISKMKKRFNISPRTAKEIADIEDDSEKLKVQILINNNLRASMGQRKPNADTIRKHTSPCSPSLQSRMTRVKKTSQKSANVWLDVCAKFEMFRELQRACDQQLDEKDRTIGQLQANVDRQDNEIGDMRSQMSTLQAIESTHSHCKDGLDAQISQNAIHQTTIKRMRDSADKLTKQVKAQKDRQTEQDNVISGLRKDAQEHKTSLDEAQTRIADLEQEIEEAKISLSDCQTKLDEAEGNATELEKAQKELHIKGKALEDLQDVHLRCSQQSATEAMDVDPTVCTTPKNNDQLEPMDVDSAQRNTNVNPISACEDHERQIKELEDRCNALSSKISDQQATISEVVMEDASDSVQEVRRVAENEKGLLQSQLVNEQFEHSVTRGKLRRKERELSEWLEKRSATGKQPENETEKSKRLQKQERDLVIRLGKIKDQEEQLERREAGLPPVLLDHRMTGQPQSVTDAMHELEQQQMRKKVNDAEKNFKTLKTGFDREKKARQDDADKHKDELQKEGIKHAEACRSLNDRIKDLERRLKQAARDQEAESEKPKEELPNVTLSKSQKEPGKVGGQNEDAEMGEGGGADDKFVAEDITVAGEGSAARQGSDAEEGPTAGGAQSVLSKRKNAPDENERDEGSMKEVSHKRCKVDTNGTSTAPTTRGGLSSHVAMMQGNANTPALGQNNASVDMDPGHVQDDAFVDFFSGELGSRQPLSVSDAALAQRMLNEQRARNAMIREGKKPERRQL